MDIFMERVKIIMTTTCNSSYILEFNKIQEMLSAFASTEYAKNKISALAPFLRELQLKQAIGETNDARAILDSIGSPQIPSVSEAKSILEIVEKDGMLFPEQLDSFARFIASCRRLKSYLKKAESTERSLAFCGTSIDPLDEPFEEINRCICGSEIDSNASKELAGIRRQIENVNAQIKSKLDELLKSKKAYCNDSFVSMKNGHYTLPVKKEYKNQVSGVVITVSSTGTTCFIEPTAAIKLGEKLNLLKTEETVEKEKILYAIAALISQHDAKIRQNIAAIETLDFAFAKGKLSVEMNAVSPEINTQRRIRIVRGRHPLLSREECVPLDFEMGGNVRGIVITGPNTGGKTVTLKLVGLFSLMAQCGLHVPCESASLCMNSNILCDIGDGQNISENLSTFSAHITNIVSILENTTRETLVLLDELGSGTDPAEGMGIAIAILEELRRKNCLFVATTHYPEVKSYAENAGGLLNARMTFDKETLKPQYKLIIGEAGESCAFYIARQLGFPPHLLNFAYEQTYRQAPRPVNGESGFIRESCRTEPSEPEKKKGFTPKIEKAPQLKNASAHAAGFQIGDSVIVYPEKKIGVIFASADEKGMLGVQIQGKKQKVNHKRVQLKTPASELYPPDYDFSILFDSVENRKARRQMAKKHQPDSVIVHEQDIG